MKEKKVLFFKRNIRIFFISTVLGMSGGLGMSGCVFQTQIKKIPQEKTKVHANSLHWKGPSELGVYGFDSEGKTMGPTLFVGDSERAYLLAHFFSKKTQSYFLEGLFYRKHAFQGVGWSALSKQKVLFQNVLPSYLNFLTAIVLPGGLLFGGRFDPSSRVFFPIRFSLKKMKWENLLQDKKIFSLDLSDSEHVPLSMSFDHEGKSGLLWRSDRKKVFFSSYDLKTGWGTPFGILLGGSASKIHSLWDGYGWNGFWKGNRFLETSFLSPKMGKNHNCFVFKNKQVACFGENSNGQLGLGTVSANELAPKLVPSLFAVEKIVSGAKHSCVFVFGGTPWCWGSNDKGQLGVGQSSLRKTIPTQVSSLKNIHDLSVGAEHSCAIDSNKEIWCWGRNLEGELGDGSGTFLTNSLHGTQRWLPHLVWGHENELGFQEGFFDASFTPAFSGYGSAQTQQKEGLSNVDQFFQTQDRKFLYLKSATDSALSVYHWDGKQWNFKSGVCQNCNAPGFQAQAGLLGLKKIIFSKDESKVFTIGDRLVEFSRNTQTGALSYVQEVSGAGFGGVRDFAISSDEKDFYFLSATDQGLLRMQKDANDTFTVKTLWLDESSPLWSCKSSTCPSTYIEFCDGGYSGSCTAGYQERLNTGLNFTNILGLKFVEFPKQGKSYLYALMDGKIGLFERDTTDGSLTWVKTLSVTGSFSIFKILSNQTQVFLFENGSFQVCDLQSSDGDWVNCQLKTLSGTPKRAFFSKNETFLYVVYSDKIGVFKKEVSGSTVSWNSVQTLDASTQIGWGNLITWGGFLSTLEDKVYLLSQAGVAKDHSLLIFKRNLSSGLLSFEKGYAQVGNSFGFGPLDALKDQAMWAMRGFSGEGESVFLFTPGSFFRIKTQTQRTPQALQLSLGRVHSCGVFADQSVRCWGDNSCGQLGLGTSGTCGSGGVGVSYPRKITKAWGTLVGVRVGADHSCAWNTDGALWCWGKNDFGQVGTGASGAPVVVPTLVSALNSEKVKSVALGDAHSCALLDTGVVKCWGKNLSGQLGLGSTSNSELMPQKVLEVPVIQSIAAGGDSTCLLAQKGSMFCFGRNDYGQLGIGSTQNQVTAQMQLDLLHCETNDCLYTVSSEIPGFPQRIQIQSLSDDSIKHFDLATDRKGKTLAVFLKKTTQPLSCLPSGSGCEYRLFGRFHTAEGRWLGEKALDQAFSPQVTSYVQDHLNVGGEESFFPKAVSLGGGRFLVVFSLIRSDVKKGGLYVRTYDPTQGWGLVQTLAELPILGTQLYRPFEKVWIHSNRLGSTYLVVKYVLQGKSERGWGFALWKRSAGGTWRRISLVGDSFFCPLSSSLCKKQRAWVHVFRDGRALGVFFTPTWSDSKHLRAFFWELR